MCGGIRMETALSAWGGAVDECTGMILSKVLKDRWEKLIPQEGRHSRRDSMREGPEGDRELRSCVFTVAWEME